ncbi:arylamine N-acetyltransferase, partial [Bacillus cereus]|nr:arylamine N-acetyltransferase [Bacillus cereus]
LIEDGHISLTKQSFTETRKGQKHKQIINEEEYQQILKETFDIYLDKYPNKILERG